MGKEKVFDETVQKNCVFPIGGAHAKQKCNYSLKALPALEEVYEEITAIILREDGPLANYRCDLLQFHILFGYGQEAHFAVHNDQEDFVNSTSGRVRPDLSAIIQLSRSGTSEMYIVTAEKPHIYKKAGSGALFESLLYHRGGKQTYGTVKVAFFIRMVEKKVKPKKEESSSDEEDSAVKKEQEFKRVKVEEASCSYQDP